MFLVTYLRRELRPRMRQAIFTALGPPLATCAHTTKRIAERDPMRRRAGLLAAGLAAVAVAVAACGGGSNAGSPGVANVGSSSASAAPSSSASPGPLALARCMRAHGFTDFPDPNSSGSFDLTGGGDLNPNNPTYQAAAQACRSLGSALGKSGPRLSPQQRAAMLQFAECMRAHGITGFPDPGSNGDIAINGQIDRYSPQFQAADTACKHFLPGGMGMRGGS
jgi:hypothetical protein